MGDPAEGKLLKATCEVEDNKHISFMGGNTPIHVAFLFFNSSCTFNSPTQQISLALGFYSDFRVKTG